MFTYWKTNFSQTTHTLNIMWLQNIPNNHVVKVNAYAIIKCMPITLLQALSFGGGIGVGYNGAGAGHGGMGGRGTTSHHGGYFYGDVKDPQDAGSDAIFDPGFSTSKPVVLPGGGVIKINATTSATINGTCL